MRLHFASNKLESRKFLVIAYICSICCRKHELQLIQAYNLEAIKKRSRSH